MNLHIVAFNIPYPPDYGGVIDVFYKIKALYECGVSIYLHCFEYNRPQASELEKYCVKVFYYPRKSGFRYQLSIKPYIVATRNEQQLLGHLSEINAPVLFEGLHSCYFIDNKALSNRILLVRTHNIEHEYYHHLSKAEKNIFRKLFFRIEAFKLKLFENQLVNATTLLAISPNDNRYFDQKFGKSRFIPAFHPFSGIKSKTGHGDYILFHGNLSVAENIQAVEYLIRKVFPHISQKIIVAGKSPSEKLIRKLNLLPHVQLVANPGHDEMEQLISNAHICLLPTFQDTGLKLKLLASLFVGRFCIVNRQMVFKTGLEHLCHQANSPEEIILKINELFNRDFTNEEIEIRKITLNITFSNRHNAQKIISIIES